MAKHKYIESPYKLWELFEAYVLNEKQNPMYKQEYVGKTWKNGINTIGNTDNF